MTDRARKIMDGKRDRAIDLMQKRLAEAKETGDWKIEIPIHNAKDILYILKQTKEEAGSR